MTGQAAHEPAPPRRDWLLTSARWLATFLTAVCALIAAGLSLALFAVPVFHAELLARLAKHAGHSVDTQAVALIVALLVALIAFAILAVLWLRELRRIIGSVALGDAFNPVNAERLARMGWLTVAIELIAIPGGGFSVQLTRLLHIQHIDFSLSLGGVLMALVLFILARVFREGAKMREELEGTV